MPQRTRQQAQGPATPPIAATEPQLHSQRVARPTPEPSPRRLPGQAPVAERFRPARGIAARACDTPLREATPVRPAVPTLRAGSRLRGQVHPEVNPTRPRAEMWRDTRQ